MRRRLPVCLLALALMYSLLVMPALAAGGPDATSSPEPSADAVQAAAADAAPEDGQAETELFSTPAPSESPEPTKEPAGRIVEPAPLPDAGEDADAAAPVTEDGEPTGGEEPEGEETPDGGEEQP